MYFSIPLEQGLRPLLRFIRFNVIQYFSIPLEQGLRHILLVLFRNCDKYFSIPLEQGLRRLKSPLSKAFLICILVFH